MVARSTSQRAYCGAHIDFRYYRKGVQLRRSLGSILCNWLSWHGFPETEERAGTVDSRDTKTIMFRLNRTRAVAKASALIIAIDEGD